MNRFIRSLALASIAATCAFSLPAAHADGPDINPMPFVQVCDADKDGMVSKQEVMKQVEKMFDKHDTKKMGKLDSKQVEHFLRSFMMLSGA